MFVNYVIAMGLAVLAILIAVILGDYGPWYLSWFLGTGFMVLVAVSAGVLFEAQEEAAQATGDAKAPPHAADVAQVIAHPKGGKSGKAG